MRTLPKIIIVQNNYTYISSTTISNLVLLLVNVYWLSHLWHPCLGKLFNSVLLFLFFSLISSIMWHMLNVTWNEWFLQYFFFHNIPLKGQTVVFTTVRHRRLNFNRWRLMNHDIIEKRETSLSTSELILTFMFEHWRERSKSCVLLESRMNQKELTRADYPTAYHRNIILSQSGECLPPLFSFSPSHLSLYLVELSFKRKKDEASESVVWGNAEERRVFLKILLQEYPQNTSSRRWWDAVWIFYPLL